MDVARLTAAWTARLRVPLAAFVGPEVSVTVRADLDSVVAVALGQGCVALCPPPLVDALQPLARETLLDADALADALAGVARCEPIGTADLWFTDAAPPEGAAVTRIATADDLEALCCACTEDEWDEAGLQTMAAVWVAHDAGGTVTAAAGFDDWGDLAHLGVLAAPWARGHGFADAVASRAVGAAIASGRLAQWRCRAGNGGSARLARRLGFERLGVQAAVSLS